MNPETKLIIDEFNRRFTENDLKWDHRFSEQETRLNRQIQDLEKAHGDRVLALEDVAKELNEWKSSIEGTVDDTRLEVKKMSRNWAREVIDNPGDSSGVYAPLPAVVERPPPALQFPTPMIGPRVEPSHRASGFGVVSALVHSPVKGEHPLPKPPTPKSVHQYDAFHSSHEDINRMDSRRTHNAKLPKVNFPVFDGDQPKVWLRDCLDYFDLYEVDPNSWVRVARMHLVAAAKRWYNSVESQIQDCNWKTFTSLVLNRFGQEHHELLLRQLFQIRQIGTVDEYIEQFSAIVDQLGAYNRTTDPMFYTMRFIDGLKDHIRAAVALHRPPNWDTACVLAQLQEDLTAPRKPEVRKWDVASGAKPFTRTAMPLPPPPRIDKLPAPVEHKPAGEAGRSLSVDERWAALRSQRRAQGLCYRCGAKWSRDHRCPPAVQLHVLEELLELFNLDDIDPQDAPDEVHEHAELTLMLSIAAVTGVASPRTMCFDGKLGDSTIHILLDSGSTHTFISESVASSSIGLSALSGPVHVQVANGQILTCSQYIPAAVWSVQGLEFQSDLKVLPLTSYDMILGLDWLESHSPMSIHWAHKWLRIPYKDHHVQLNGILPEVPVDSVLQLSQASTAAVNASVACSAAIQQLLDEFASLFEQPTQLPPSRACDHAIPLVPGAGPVYSRPYRFAPAVKDEVEKQVHEMLTSGLIQKSSNPFASPVLLVKKKDGTWRFCVDYRQLNSITQKSKYPVPLIDDLLDELGQASWFSKLDLRSGFHQILLQPGEAFKTAFQTHFGQFEFRVMPFGLTGAPGTFQAAMNSTLAPLLRKFVLVFFDDILIYSRTYEEHLDHLKQVFELLQVHDWKLKLSKCAFAQRSINYLGHVISGDGVATDPEKITTVTS